MFKEYARQFKIGILICDLLITFLSWFPALYFRFYMNLPWQDPGQGSIYLYYLPIIISIPVWFIIFAFSDVYTLRRGSLLREQALIIRNTILGTLVVVSLVYFYEKIPLSRLAYLYFWILNSIALILYRTFLRQVILILRRKGLHQNGVLIIGANEIGEGLYDRLRAQAWMGFKIIGFLDDKKPVGTRINGVQILGRISEIKPILEANKIKKIFIALPFEAYHKIKSLMNELADQLVDISVVPDVFEFGILMNNSAEDLDGVPIVHLVKGNIIGFNSVLKRSFDIVFSAFILIVCAPLMLLISLMVKLTSDGPVLYTQSRMGLDGKCFQMLKFRSMPLDAEAESGPVWSRADDRRSTWVGKLLRRTSLDELPQFFNVLKGEMSVVGPRPERPHFIEQFRNKIPGYMLRHKVKAGITGWAQINGWRGNTSLEKRIEHDLYYIEKWSLWFDLRIIWLTMLKGLINKNAY